MVNLQRWCGVPGFQAVFTQCVGVQVASTDLSPDRAVASVDLRVTLVAAVSLIFYLGVLGAEPLGAQLGAAGIPARSLRLVRHGRHLFYAW